MKDKESIRKWLDNELTEEERVAFEKTDDFQFLTNLTQALQEFKASGYAVERELERYHRETRGSSGASKSSWISPLLKIAAVLFFLAGISYWFLRETPAAEQPFKITDADQKEYFFPDSSYVVLNKSSAISYNRAGWAENRNVILTGEAYFRVEKSQQFTVITDFGQVSVLGTRFNVKNRPNYFEVTCYEGRVAVQTDLSREVLEEGGQYRMINGVVRERTLNGTSLPSWTENITTFTSVPIIEVLREFERQYDVTIKYHKLDTNRLFTGSFPHTDRLVALKSIAIPLGLEYRMGEDEIILIE